MSISSTAIGTFEGTSTRLYTHLASGYRFYGLPDDVISVQAPDHVKGLGTVTFTEPGTTANLSLFLKRCDRWVHEETGEFALSIQAPDGRVLKTATVPALELARRAETALALLGLKVKTSRVSPPAKSRGKDPEPVAATKPVEKSKSVKSKKKNKKKANV
ncbi:hypothetical protein [Streptomyces sp. CS014]|uniref:hypothetical protein n=1 Tax=Streptomyces sp. CS014 TaxID=2162707 RepID=UPI000D5164EA|nr:hypothetical protein [Streptomyces sp. CS014]PVD04514.1 hypothetical protein DBP12_03565 [Streptomyces sp. CS014]